MKGITVIICCYNSVSRLQPTLEHLIKQTKISADQWEVLVVDNASKDDTAVYAEDLWYSTNGVNKPSFKVIKEATPGLAAARLCGIHNASFDFLLFCDDDNWLQPNYIYDAVELISKNQNVGVIGGCGMPFFEASEPPYFWKNQFHTLAVGEQYTEEGDITNSRQVVYGAGMIVNKLAFFKLINDYQFKFQSTGRIGASLASSEDHELCLALRMIGYKILWYKKLKFYHYIPTNRTTIDYYKKLFLGFGLSNPLLIGYQLDKNNPLNVKNDYRYLILRKIKNIVVLYLKINYQLYFKNKSQYQILELTQELYTNIGSLKSTLALRNSIRDNFIKTKIFTSISHPEKAIK